MSAIAGLYHPEQPRPLDSVRVGKMLETMQHRSGAAPTLWSAPGVVFGHAASAAQAGEGMAAFAASTDAQLAVALDGRLYNAADLRATLQARGHLLADAGDAHILLAAWSEWGAGCLDQLDGIFAFALQDAAQGALFLARDRLGVKPLHYTFLPDGSLAFASELKGLLALPNLRVEANSYALDDYLAFGYIPDDSSLVAGVEKLAAGHCLYLRRGQGDRYPTQWWDLDFTKRITVSEAEAEDYLGQMLRAAVRSRMASEAPVGALLSGGLDSATLVALMAEASPQAIKSFALTRANDQPARMSDVDVIVRRYATDHVSRAPEEDGFAIADLVAFHCDEPFADIAALQALDTNQLARGQVTAAMSGSGADDVFAGHSRLIAFHQQAQKRRRIPSTLRRGMLAPLARYVPGLVWTAQDDTDAYMAGSSMTAPAMRRALYSEDFIARIGGYQAEERWRYYLDTAPASEALDRAQYAEMKIALPARSLVRLDRMSAAVGLDVHVPFLDHHLVEFAATLPAHARIQGDRGKWLLRKTMERYLPPEIAHRPKTTRLSPLDDWFRGSLAAEARALAASPTLARTGWFDMKAIDAMVMSHLAGRGALGAQLWQLHMLEKSLQRLFGI